MPSVTQRMIQSDDGGPRRRMVGDQHQQRDGEQQPRDRHGVRRRGERRRAERLLVDGHQAAARSGPSAAVTVSDANVPASSELVRDQDHAVDLRRLAMAPPHPRLVHEDFDSRPDEFVTSGPRDRLLALAQLGQTLVDQAAVDLAVEPRGVRPVLLGEGEEAAPVELRLVDERQQLVVVVLGLARDSRR